MIQATELDVFSCALDGATLIEASAGTGKTWNICGLYLRLLLEREMSVQQILVVTFTNAATAELRERIRARISDTLGYLREQGAAPGDPFVPALVQSLQNFGLAPERMQQLLQQALQSFDEAAIFTIHSFCQRALADAPFAAGMPFRTELMPDDSLLLQETVNDYWRTHIGGEQLAPEPELALYLLECKDTPQRWAQLLRRSLAKPSARLLWPASAPAAGDPAQRLRDLFEPAKATWAREAAGIAALLDAAAPGLKASHGAEQVAQACAACATFFSGDEAPRLPPSLRGVNLKLLRQSALQTATKSKHSPPGHIFFEQVEALLEAAPGLQQQRDEALASARLALLHDMLEHCAPALRQRKRELRVCSYNDLLYNLYEALDSGSYPWLAQALRQRYPAALIDEFQDTDPLQFAIFHAIYGDSDAPLFLVGDPKQAIYSFRNADLHTYLRAKESTGAQYTLSANQRSAPQLIAGLNTLFGANPAAFMLDGLQYQPVQFGDKPRQPLLDRSGQETAQLQIWTLPGGADILARGTAIAAAIAATAAEIARLIDAGQRGQITLGEAALRPGDIAVLIRSHAQGSAVRAALAALNIGSVELSQASVFASGDAADIETLLCAVLEPARTGLLLAALASPLLGADAAAIAAIGHDEKLLAARMDQFAAYHEMWLQRGVGYMLRQLLEEQDVSRRLLERADGERRLTNLLHLAELLHQAAQHGASPETLLQWLQTQRSAAAEGSSDEASQLRLESDENLVQIVTVHKSKGLEYPIVFCPLLWDGYSRPSGAGDGLEYHDPEGDSVIDFRLDAEGGDHARAAIKFEQSAETMRLIYVALTRAAQRCYLVAGNYSRSFGKNISFKEGTRNPLNWMAAGAGMTAPEWFEATLEPAAIEAAWNALQHAQPAIGLAPLPSVTGQPVRFAQPQSAALQAAIAPPPLQAGWRLGSFTQLSLGAAPERAASDHDARIVQAPSTPPQMPTPPPASDDILFFPRGAAAGDCLHAVFETIAFNAPQTWDAAIAEALRNHPQPNSGGSPEASAALQRAMIRNMLQDVLRAPLIKGEDKDLRLQTISADQRLTELEFHLPAPHLSATDLNRLLQASGYEVPELAFRDLSGYLHGFIDLVFEHEGCYYLLDWKSNHLGFQPQDYDQAALARALAEHRYHLQYLLYAVALQRYLRQRLPDYDPERHFGGVLYLFVRGVRPGWTLADGSQSGVYFHRPQAATLDAIERLIDPAHQKEAA